MDFESGTFRKSTEDRTSERYLSGSTTPTLIHQGEKSKQNKRWIFTKKLYHETIRAGLYQADDKTLRYLIKVNRLTEEEKEICQLLHQDILKENQTKNQNNQNKLPPRQTLLAHLSNWYPLLTDTKRELIATALFFHHDQTRWIRLLIQEIDILEILCPGPDTAVLIRYQGYENLISTNITLKRNHLDNLASFFLTSAKINPAEINIPDPIRFGNGVQISLSRQGDSSGWSWKIGIYKKDTTSEQILEKKKEDSKPKSGSKKPSLSSGSTTDNANRPNIQKSKATTTQAQKTRIPDPRIDDLISSIFDRGASIESTRSGESKKDIDEETTKTPEGFVDRYINPLKEGMKNLTASRSEKLAQGPSHDPPPIPDTMQAPSVLNVQTGDGIVAEEAYWLYQPHAYVAILQDQSKERTYRIVEPDLTPRERIILEETHETLRDVLVYDKPVTKGELFLDYTEVAKVVKTYDPHITEDRLSVLYYYLRRNLNGYGKIDALMYDELLEDISCNGHNLPVYIHHRYYGSIPTSVRFESEELNRFVLKLSQKADKQVSLTSPLLDASLPNGSRAQITYSDVVSTKGSSFTIRKFRSDPMTPATLMAFGTYSDELLAFIWLALENRQSLIVVGGTASGKTSAMNAFSFFIPHNSKIVSLEDTREIQIPQKNWLPVQTRASNTVNDRGSVDLFDLLKASLRQRPEYIIVGEVRGNEAQTLFQAMNSGHTTISTLHAGNIEEALNRLTNEPINVPPAMFGALNLMVIQTFHYRNGRMIRRCDAIHEIVLGESDKVGWNTLYEYEPVNDSFKRVYTQSKTLRTIQYMHNWSDEEIQYHLDLRAGFLAKLRNQYSTDPEILIRMITDLRRQA